MTGPRQFRVGRTQCKVECGRATHSCRTRKLTNPALLLFLQFLWRLDSRSQDVPFSNTFAAGPLSKNEKARNLPFPASSFGSFAWSKEIWTNKRAQHDVSQWQLLWTI